VKPEEAEPDGHHSCFIEGNDETRIMTTIPQITENGKIPVVVWNESKHECLLKAGDRIGAARKADVINEVEKRFLENETGEEWRPSEEIRAIGSEISREEYKMIKQVLNKFNDEFSKTTRM